MTLVTYIKFRTKKNAIENDKILFLVNDSVKLVEKYTMWQVSKDKAILIDKQEFDRTILIKNFNI